MKAPREEAAGGLTMAEAVCKKLATASFWVWLFFSAMMAS